MKPLLKGLGIGVGIGMAIYLSGLVKDCCAQQEIKRERDKFGTGE
ncbi:hypothetical protein [Salipaludibacillus agaradhaerens]|nr:hypothetical protein [Salipaludibacillus agaradhaerens]